LLIQKIGKKTWNQKEEKYHSIRSTQWYFYQHVMTKFLWIDYWKIIRLGDMPPRLTIWYWYYVFDMNIRWKLFGPRCTP
jgi:hypothetical protein